MTPKAWSLLVAVGVVAGVVIAIPRPGVTKADLIDAGILTDCVKRERTCLIYSPDGTDCPDAGRYCNKTVGFMLCPQDGGIPRTAITKRTVQDRIVDDSAWCGQARATALNADDVVDAPFDCACSSGAACQWKGMDGTAALSAAPTGFTLPATSAWVGAGCRPKACVEVAGVSSWPQGCPP